MRQLVTATLVVYWTMLCIGTHLPSRFVAAPLLVSDKVLHFLGYTGLSFLLATLLPLLGVGERRVYWGALLVAIVYGAVDELGQIPVPGRTAELGDWFANVAGAVVGVTCYRLTTVAVGDQVFRLWPEKKPSPP
jgi:VanZ family protein